MPELLVHLQNSTTSTTRPARRRARAPCPVVQLEDRLPYRHMFATLETEYKGYLSCRFLIFSTLKTRSSIK